VRSATADVAISWRPTPVRTSTNLSYSITVKNVGPDGAADVRVTDALPSGTQFVSATHSQGSCVTPAWGASGTMVSSLGTASSGGAATIDRVAEVVSPGKDRVTNTATVQTSVHDPEPANNSVTVETATFGRQ